MQDLTLHRLGVMCQAYAWWATAVGSGYHNAMSAKDKLATYMSGRDLADANKLAGEYWKKYVLK